MRVFEIVPAKGGSDAFALELTQRPTLNVGSGQVLVDLNANPINDRNLSIAEDPAPNHMREAGYFCKLVLSI